jgi:hypothetical protein
MNKRAHKFMRVFTLLNYLGIIHCQIGLLLHLENMCNFDKIIKRLEIIKNGVVIEEKELKEKAFFLVGKLPDLCDLVMEHPSISRYFMNFKKENMEFCNFIKMVICLYMIWNQHMV